MYIFFILSCSLSTNTEGTCLVRLLGLGNLQNIALAKLSAFCFRFNLHKTLATTVWILNLAFADLLYCLFYLSIFVVTPSWIFGGTSCRFFAFFYTSAKLTAWMSVAMVAFNRCVMVSNLGNSNFLSSRKNQVLIMIFLRIYGFICTLPTAFGVSKI